MSLTSPASAQSLAEFLLARIAEDEASLSPKLRRECKAKLRLLNGHHAGTHRCMGGVTTWGDPDCIIKATLAAVYDDHPDYRNEWRS